MCYHALVQSWKIFRTNAHRISYLIRTFLFIIFCFSGTFKYSESVMKSVNIHECDKQKCIKKMFNYFCGNKIKI